MRFDPKRRAARAAAFASAARRYWLEVFPTVRREIHRLEAEASRIPDPVLRRLATTAQRSKWASLEGASAFAAFVRPARRPAVARLMVGFQAVYDYADTLMEQPSATPAANAAQLHRALLAIVEPERAHIAYYHHHLRDQDGDYLARLVDACRGVVRELPSFKLVAPRIREHTQRIIAYQSRANLAGEREYGALARWASEVSAHTPRLRWWETWAACGSSLATLALLAAAADPTMTPARAAAIEATYWPWAGALHTMLDGLVDRAEDAATKQHSLLGHYRSTTEAAERAGLLTRRATGCAEVAGVEHSLIVAGMASLYLADPRAWTDRAIAEGVLAGIGGSGKAAIAVLRARRLARRATPLRRLSSSGYLFKG